MFLPSVCAAQLKMSYLYLVLSAMEGKIIATVKFFFTVLKATLESMC